MTMNGDIADKLYRPDLMTLDLSFNNRPDVSTLMKMKVILSTLMKVKVNVCWRLDRV